MPLATGAKPHRHRGIARHRRLIGLFTTISPNTAFFPTIFFGSFAIGFGIGNTFMPLLTLAMADVPAADAGLGSGVTNGSQQMSGALGLAVLSTLAADHTQGLIADGRDTTDALISGYHLAFFTGAAVIGVGIVLALTLLPRVARAEEELGELPPREEAERVRALELDRQAA